MAGIAHGLDAPAVARVEDEVVAGIGDGEVARRGDREPEYVLENYGQNAAVRNDGDLLPVVVRPERV